VVLESSLWLVDELRPAAGIQLRFVIMPLILGIRLEAIGPEAFRAGMSGAEILHVVFIAGLSE
jgi:hypothetical protein